ncbi:ABC transporter substrate-binding protein [Bradyrhizobium symbiodeficiens]|uniref:ABC transporter substrate-binding protein n=1 Tax=Bradyrhizobium symbiodeficiens TaxID=1404367 RepID=A0A2U8QET7_9BRAD|nr:ABC transporter substrate-binding protein [Bradyrhizobium symbiodeficiens]AWM08279.1 urea ABC transporter [Bradyrhizobium symbiodeficiens]QDF38787.1 urea ABC transporter [Bradyrhizobium symbiodeficiens]QIP09103.1 transporter substrate-binding protein [Bradyrhizobium symbiodeficiens]
MSFSRRRFLRHSALATTTLIAAPAVFRSGAYGAESPIVIGSLHDQSGPIAASGTPMVYALQLAVDELNAGGGLLGRPLKVIHYDTQSNIQMYSQFAQQLAVKDKVDVVHGGITSASREAVRPTFDRFKVLYFYNVLYEGGVCDRNTFCTGTTPAQTVEKLVPSAMKKSGKKAYIIAADYNYGQITAKWMTKYVKDNGGEVLSTDFFPLDVTNFGTTISKIQAAKPDIILSALVGGNHTAFYRQWTSAGMKGKIPIASTTFGLVNEPSTLDAAESDSILGAYGYFEELTTPASKSFVEKIKKAHPDTPYISELAACTYEGVMLWAAGVKKAASIDRMKVIAALEDSVAFDGPSGKVSLDKATHHTTRNAFLAEVKDRKWSVLESYSDVKPADTASVCDLVKNPNDTKQYIINL